MVAIDVAKQQGPQRESATAGPQGKRQGKATSATATSATATEQRQGKQRRQGQQAQSNTRREQRRAGQRAQKNRQGVLPCLLNPRGMFFSSRGA
jgi:threonine/homoserine/homoserine lactone efflux protein